MIVFFINFSYVSQSMPSSKLEILIGLYFLLTWFCVSPILADPDSCLVQHDYTTAKHHSSFHTSKSDTVCIRHNILRYCICIVYTCIHHCPLLYGLTGLLSNCSRHSDPPPNTDSLFSSVQQPAMREPMSILGGII